MDLQIIIPRAPSAYQLKINWHYEVWKQEKEAKQPKFVIENIRFAHDPLWANRLMSIQAAHHGNHVVWRMGRPLLTLAAMVAVPALAGPVMVGSATFTIALWAGFEISEWWRKRNDRLT